MSHEEYRTIRAYMEEHGVKPIDYGKEYCCFRQADGRCGIWDARPQICRLYNCHVPRIQVLAANPSIVVDDDKPLIDLHDAFILNDPHDPRTRLA